MRELAIQQTEIASGVGVTLRACVSTLIFSLFMSLARALRASHSCEGVVVRSLYQYPKRDEELRTHAGISKKQEP